MMHELTDIARAIFARHGVDFADAHRAGGWTNTVWIANDVALRLSTSTGGDRIRREVSLSTLLPACAGYPQNKECGVECGHEFSVSIRVPGINLSEAWGQMDWAARTEAMRQLFSISKAIATVDVAKAAPYVTRRTWYSSLEPAESYAILERLAQRGAIRPAQAVALSKRLDRFYRALQVAPSALNHGDLTMDNAMWFDGAISSVMDFEHAAILPKQLDAWSLIRMAVGPESSVDTAAESDRDYAAIFQRKTLDFASDAISSSADMDLTIGFGTLHALRRLELWLCDPDETTPIETWEPHRTLLALAREDGGCFAPILDYAK
jgi:scyllo-inosamine 4-kinase